MTITALADRVKTEADAYRYLEELRWGDSQPVCLHCGSEDTVFIAPKNGYSRKTRTGASSERRVWRCRSCRRQFSVLTGTVFHGTKVSIRTWVFVVFEIASSKNGVSAREIERKYGVCCRTAWFMLHRIREAMSSDGLLSTMRGTIVADETWIGGDPRNLHAKDRKAVRPYRPGMNVHTDKVPVFSLINSETGEARSRVVPNVTGAVLRKIMAENIDIPASVLHTDSGTQYKVLGKEFAFHGAVNHNDGEYVRDGISTNKAENFFSQLKRSLDGTHHHVSREHLDRYLAEFDYRYSTRKMSDTARMERLIGRVGGRRLTYKLVKA